MSFFGGLPSGSLGAGMGQPAGNTLLGVGGGGTAAAGAGSFGGFSLALAAAGAVMGAVGGFYNALSERNQLRSRALSLDFEASMAEIDARSAEVDAQWALRAGRQERALATLRHGQAFGERLAGQGASGLQVGVGSSAELLASSEWAKQVDAVTIDVNAQRAANAARVRSTAARNRALLTRVSARNVRRGAGTINPWMSAFGSLLGSGSQVAQRWYAYQNP